MSMGAWLLSLVVLCEGLIPPSVDASTAHVQTEEGWPSQEDIDLVKYELKLQAIHWRLTLLALYAQVEPGYNRSLCHDLLDALELELRRGLERSPELLASEFAHIWHQHTVDLNTVLREVKSFRQYLGPRPASPNPSLQEDSQPIQSFMHQSGIGDWLPFW